VLVEYPEYRACLAVAAAQTGTAEPGAFSPSLGATYISYRETNIPDLAQTALTGTVSYRKLVGRWDFGANAYLTLVPLTKTAGSGGARFLGVNARGGYLLTPRGRWRASLMGGVFYTTMLVSGSAFGYRNLAWRQVYPTVTRLSGRHAWSAYVKISPLSSGLSLSLASRELAGGAGWTRALGSGRHFGLHWTWPTCA
jgi:hypothetical protein